MFFFIYFDGAFAHEAILKIFLEKCQINTTKKLQPVDPMSNILVQ